MPRVDSSYFYYIFNTNATQAAVITDLLSQVDYCGACLNKPNAQGPTFAEIDHKI